MAAARKNLSADQGATFRMEFTLTVGSTGAPWDLTGFSARMQVRQSPEASVKLLDLSETSGITLGDAAGTVLVEVLDLQVVPGRYVYDFELESSGGEIWRVLQGKFTVDANVTR